MTKKKTRTIHLLLDGGTDAEDDAWLAAALTPEELARAKQAAKGPMYDMDTLERIMRTWNQIDVSAQEAVLLHLRVSMKPHRDMIKDAADADAAMGPLTNALERHNLMIDAIVTAMKFLAGKDLSDTTEWLAVEPVRREFIIGNLLGLYTTSRDNYKHGLDNGLTHAAQRFDDIAEAAYVAATALGWVHPQSLAAQVQQATKEGTWSIIDRVGDVHLFTAAWSVPGAEDFDPPPAKKGKKGKKK